MSTSTILKKQFPTLKQLQNQIKSELIQYEQATQKSINSQNLQKLKAYNTYLKRSSPQPNQINNINDKIAQLEKENDTPSNELKDSVSFENIITQQYPNGFTDQQKLNNLSNVYDYLKNQREYFNLLLRYNPGLSMDKTENITRSANRVGLQVPE